jgi:hypothetical protein
VYKGLPSRKNNGLVDRLKEQFPDIDFEEYYGGQYNYNYYITTKFNLEVQHSR